METLIAFGDSILKGVVYEDGRYKISEAPFCRLCENALHIMIKNKATFGSTITKGESVVNKNLAAIQSSSCKYVLLEFGGNDCDYRWKEVSEQPDIEHYPLNMIAEFRAGYERVINTITTMGKIPVLLSLPPINAYKYLAHISRKNEKDKDHILHWLQNDIQFLTNWHERYNIEVFVLAADHRIPVIDITSVFLERKNYDRYLCGDGIHPNAGGHRLIADTILSYVLNRNMGIGLVQQSTRCSDSP